MVQRDVNLWIGALLRGRRSSCVREGSDLSRSLDNAGSTFSYVAYGLGIRAAMPLPELVTGEAEGEVSIRFGRVKHPRFLETSETGSAFFSPAPKEDYLFWRGVGSFLVRDAKEIVVDPSPGLDEKVLRLLLLGPVLAVLLRQRGHLLLHASAIAVAEEAILFMGSSGDGKSTMAAALRARGHGLVTDDVAVVRTEESPPLVYPSFPHLKLWPETLVSLGDDPEKLPQPNPHLEKRARPAATKFSPTPLPLKKIYILNEGSTMGILPLGPREAFVQLVRHTYGSDYGLQPALGVGSPAHFFRCKSIVDNVTVCSLRRHKSLPQLPDLVRLVEKDLTQGTEGASGAN